MSLAKTCAAVATITSLIFTPALAATMRQQHQERQACVSLAKLKHPDLKGKLFGAEVQKCRDNPEGYNSAG